MEDRWENCIVTLEGSNDINGLSLIFLKIFSFSFFFFFNDTATTEIYTLSLHDALPIYCLPAHLTGSTYNEGGGQSFDIPIPYGFGLAVN